MRKEGKEDARVTLDRLEEEYFNLHEKVDIWGKSTDAERMWEIYKQMIILKRRIFDLIKTSRKEENATIHEEREESKEDNIVSRVLRGKLILKKKDIIPLAEIAFYEGRSQEALRLFLNVLEQNIADPMAIKNVAEMYLYEGFADKWEKLMNRAISLAEQQQDINVLFFLGYFAEECGGIVLAQECYHKVINLGPEGQDGIDIRAHIQAFTKKYLTTKEVPSSPEE